MRLSLIAGAIALLFSATPQLATEVAAQSASTETVICQSTGGTRSVCRVRGRIQEVSPVASFSNNPCLYGYSWGYGKRYVWVDKGCAAQFDVSVQSRGQQVVTPEPAPQPAPQPAAPEPTPAPTASTTKLNDAAMGTIVAQGACTGLYPPAQDGGAPGYVFAVPRRCNADTPDCNTICNQIAKTIPDRDFRKKIRQTRPSCFNSIHVYSAGEGDWSAAGTMSYVYNECRGGCGPNFCCCSAQN